MMDILERLNNEVPEYMKGICQKHHLMCRKLDSLSTALVGKNYAVVFSMDRFRVDLSYIYKEGPDYRWENCDNFLSERFDDEDRKNLLPNLGVEAHIRNDLSVLAHGLESKWPDVLAGHKEWLRDYKRSIWYSESNAMRLRPEMQAALAETGMFDDWV